MKTVTVKASRQYDVTIGSGLLSNLGETIRRLSNAETVCIVSDHHVFPIYGDTVKKSLADAGYHICEFVFQAGENSKNPSVLST